MVDPHRTSDQRLANLRERLTHVPHLPGVYIHKSSDGKVLYVGKAKNLQNRLRSYFTGLDRHTPKTRALVARVFDFEVMVVDNENESLLLENNLIKHHRPPYNILLRDDKTYPYLKVTLEEEWPRVLQTRKRRNDGGAYFGPYSNAAELQATQSVIQRFFPLVKCTPNVFRTVSRPCNYHSIKRCLGPCKLDVDRQHYKDLVERVLSLLSGKTHDLSQKIKQDMSAAALAMNFEKAAELRDQLRALEKLAQQQSVTFIPGFNADVIDFAWSSSAVAVYFAVVRDGKLIGGNSHVIREGLERITEFAGEAESTNITSDNAAKSEFILQVVGQFYATHEIPPQVYLPASGKILSDGACKSLQLLLDSLEENRSRLQERRMLDIHLFFSARSDAAKSLKGTQKKLFTEAFDGLCEMVKENAKTKLQDMLNADDTAHRRMLAVQTLLSLPRLPHWIECYDISTFQGGSTVASGVVFRNGQPAKSEYRKYTIREVAGQDDFASLREVMRRRFREERRHEIPDLLLIDGGEPQVREVGWLLKSLGLDSVPLFGIAKSRTTRNFRAKAVAASAERIVCPLRNEAGELVPDGGTETKILRNASPEFQLMTQIRNEAHRFAISFHRKKRDSRSLRSLLTEISGLGPKRRKKLLLEFGSVEKIAQAGVDELMEKAGLPSSVAQNVLDFFEAKRKGEPRGEE
jgi:excinuclease ABC subunit C